MGATIARRLLAAIPVLLGLTIIVFAIMAMIPGDPATAILGSYATPENVERLNRQLGLDRSLPEQYLVWLSNVMQGDLGRSYALNRPVLDEVLERLSATLLLAGTALVLASIAGVLAGVVSAVRQYGLADKVLTFLVLVGISTPAFWLGLLMILLFAVRWQLFPGVGDVRDLRRRRAARPPASPRLAGAHLGDRRDRGHRPPHPHRDARGAASGLRSHRSREGGFRSARWCSATR